jgi:hypothetical protein
VQPVGHVEDGRDAVVPGGECDSCRAFRVLTTLGRALRAHIEEERRVVRSASVASRDRLAAIPPRHAAEFFECAGGPTDTWPGEWLG